MSAFDILLLIDHAELAFAIAESADEHRLATAGALAGACRRTVILPLPVPGPGDAAHEREVQDAVAVTGVHDGVEPDAAHERADDDLVDLVVQDGALLERVHGADSLVVAVHLVAVIVADLRAHAGEVEHQGVAVAAALHQPVHRHPDVVLGRQPERVPLVVYIHMHVRVIQYISANYQMTRRTHNLRSYTREHDDTIAGEAEPLAEELPHALDVVDGAVKLAAAPPHAGVRDADQDGALLSPGVGGGRRPRHRQCWHRDPRVSPDARHAVALGALDGAFAWGHDEARAAVPAANRRGGRGRPPTEVHGAGRWLLRMPCCCCALAWLACLHTLPFLPVYIANESLLPDTELIKCNLTFS
jgi:hypothetical protein